MGISLVTGAAGFIGSSLSDALLAQGGTVRGVDCFTDYYPREMKESNLARARASTGFEFVETDLMACDLEALFDDVEVVHHLAARRAYARAGVTSSRSTRGTTSRRRNGCSKWRA